MRKKRSVVIPGMSHSVVRIVDVLMMIACGCHWQRPQLTMRNVRLMQQEQPIWVAHTCLTFPQPNVLTRLCLAMSDGS